MSNKYYKFKLDDEMGAVFASRNSRGYTTGKYNKNVQYPKDFSLWRVSLIQFSCSSSDNVGDYTNIEVI